MGQFGIGQAVRREEDPRLLRGHGEYVGDVSRPRMAYGYVLRSPHAHAKIRGIDTRAAQQMPGEVRVRPGRLAGAAVQPGELPAGGALAESRRGRVDRLAVILSDAHPQDVSQASWVVAAVVTRLKLET